MVFYPLGIHFPESDEPAITDSVVPVLATFHAILAGFVLNKVSNEYQDIRVAIASRDREKFRALIGARIPKALHLLLGSMATLIQSMVMCLHYESPLTGMAATFSIAFVLGLYWEVAINLDNPLKGVWYINTIPEDWKADCLTQENRPA